MRILTTLSVLVGGGLLWQIPLAAQERLPIIDMHMHAHEPAVPAGAPAPCRPAPCRGIGQATATSAASLKQTLVEMDRYNVVTGFLSGDLSTVRQWVAAAPDRFIASVFLLEPGSPTAETLRAEHRAGRLAGIGEIATQLTGHRPDDPALEPYFALAAELDLPVLIHVAGIGPHVPGFRAANGDPLLLEKVLARHPNLRIYVENTGYPYADEMIALMSQYPQLYGDLSTITWVIPRSAFYAYLKRLLAAGLGKRLMFGSDQMRWPEAIGLAVQAIEEADFLTATEKRDIFHDNAVRFLRRDVGTLTDR